MALEFGVPSVDLQRELEEVATKAKALSENVRAANFLPATFPRDQLEAICRNLIGLPFGTSEGCRVPLTYARTRLPAIRRQYVSTKTETMSEGDHDVPPAVLRDENLDKLLKDLLASVTTALDQYQVESDTDIDDNIDRERGIEALHIPGTTAAATQALTLADRMGSINETVRDINQKNSQTVDNLARQYKDVQIQSGLASAELSMPNVRVSWFQPIVSQLRKMPEIIEKTGRTIQILTDIAGPLVNRWNDFKANTWKHALHEIDETGKTLEQVGQRLKAFRDGETPSSKADIVDVPDDFEISKAQRMIASGIEPPRSWWPWINKLEFEGTRPPGDTWTSLPALHTLRLERMYWYTWEPLAKLRAIKSLSLRKASGGNFNFLQELLTLEELDFSDTWFDDVSLLSRLANLRTLNLSGTRIENVGPLSSLRALETLSLDRTKVRDLTPVGLLGKLKTLSLNRTQIDSLSPLKSLHSLQNLYLQDNSINNLQPIADLRSLRQLLLGGTKVESISGIPSLQNLTSLSLAQTPIKDFAPLSTMRHLQSVRLPQTTISNLAVLSDCAELSLLDVRFTNVADLSTIADRHKLKELYLDSTKVRDLTPIGDFISLEQLTINDTAVEDITPLSKLTSLRVLHLDNTKVDDLSALTAATELEEIWLDHTPVRDLQPLADKPKLHTIWINGARVRDLSCLATNNSLTSIFVGSEARRARLAETLRGRTGIVKVVERK